MTKITRFSAPQVHGVLHEAIGPQRAGLVLTHGAGSNCEAPLLVAAASAFAAAGVSVLRCDLPFRQQRPSGPPSRASAAADRDGLRRALDALRPQVRGPLFLGGHSYGGRQASMLAADVSAVAEALLLFSYPLHPPKKPNQLRTEFWPRLKTRCVFVHGTRDGFGAVAELEAALALIPAPHQLIRIEGAGHDLRGGRFDLAPVINALLGTG